MAQLLDLPPEMIQFICGILTSPTTLLNLCLTCSVMRTHAQPLLYHAPVPRHHDYLSLVRTLIQRPDLARRVKQICVGDNWFSTTNQLPSSQDVEFFRSQLVKHQHPGENGNPVDIFDHWWETPPQHGESGGLFGPDPEGALCALAVAQTPNLEKLAIVAGYLCRFPFTAPGSLPHLRELGLRHGGTIFRADGKVVQDIFAAAPNLCSFRGYMLDGVSIPLRHDNITKVRFERTSLRAQSVENLLGGLPNLRSFSYESGGSAEEATPAQIVRALRSCAGTLEDLCLDLDNAHSHHLGPEDVIISFSELRHLKHLAMSQTVYKPSEVWGVWRPPGTLLVDMIPTCLRTLHIISGSARIMDALLVLAQHADYYPGWVQLGLGQEGPMDVSSLLHALDLTNVLLSTYYEFESSERSINL